MEDPLDALEDDLAELNPPVGILVTEDEDGGLEVTDVAGGEVDDEHAIAILLRGLIVMLGPTIFQALEALHDLEEEDDEDDEDE